MSNLSIIGLLVENSKRMKEIKSIAPFIEENLDFLCGWI
jgi:hypothetical protein